MDTPAAHPHDEHTGHAMTARAAKSIADHLSPDEQVNYDVYVPQLEALIADQKYRDYEMPANSDSSFWSDLGYTARRPFRTLTDYKNYLKQSGQTEADVLRTVDMHSIRSHGYSFQVEATCLGSSCVLRSCIRKL